MSSFEDVSPTDETPKIERHIPSVHEGKRLYCSSDDQNIGNIHEVIKLFKCEICEHKTGRKSDLKKHVESVHEEKKFNCNICDYKTTRNYNLKKHIESVHEGIKPFKCNNCDFEFAEKGKLKKHIESVHERIKPYKCNICEFETATNSDLKRHIDSVHIKIKRFECSICDFKTAENFQLKTHIESVHEGMKPFKCTICDFRCARKCNLNKHIKSVHEGIKPGLKYNYFDFETGEAIFVKPFKCHICNYDTVNKTHLKRHVDTVHEGIKLFKCKLCNYESGQKSGLKEHIESVHERSKPFQCHICQYKSATKSKLKRHMKRHEKKKSDNTSNENKNIFMEYSQTFSDLTIGEANEFKSAKEIYEASPGISNPIVLNKREGTKYDEICKGQKVISQSIKVEQISVELDPLLIHGIKEEIFQGNEATPIQGFTDVYIKQEEFGDSGYQNEQENGMIVQDIKKEFVLGE